MRKQVFAAFVICLALFIFSQVYVSRNHQEELLATPHATAELPKITVKDTEISVITVRTAEEITKGLGGTVNLPEDQGMLFLFSQQNMSRIFWMKNMVIPIDIIWIDDNKVVQIDAEVPPPDSPNVPDSALKLYPSNQPVDYVLETNAGWAARNNIVVGDSVNLESAK